MNKRTVFIPDKVPDDVIQLLKKHCEVDYRRAEEKLTDEQFVDGLHRADGLMIYSRYQMTGNLLKHAPHLKIVSNISVGYDNLNISELTSRGIMATNTPDVLTETTADLAFGLLIAAARRLTEADQFVKAGQWTGWLPSLMLGKDVHGSTMGILGMGRIGEAIARRGKGFNMNVIYHNRNRKPDVEQQLGVTYAAWDELFERADFVVILIPLSPQSRKIVGEKELRLMKQDAILINASRGAVVEEQALIRALKQQWIGGAGLDVFEHEPIAADHPFLAMPNVVTLPHIGSATRATRANMAMKAALNMVAGLTGKKPENLINPNVFRNK